MEDGQRLASTPEEDSSSLWVRFVHTIIQILTNVFRLILFVFVSVREPLALLWLRTNVYFFQTVSLRGRLATPQGSPLPTRKVVVVGDGMAEGFGDWITLGRIGGVATRLEGRIHNDPRVRQAWRVVNAGAYGSSSDSWLPVWSGPPERYAFLSRMSTESSLYSSLFGSHALAEMARPDVVAIMLGAQDYLVGLTAPASWANILSLARSIVQDQGSLVYISTLPESPSVTNVYLTQLNIHIRHYFEEEQSPEEALSIKMGPDLAAFFASPRAGIDPDANFAWDRRLLSSRGYAAAAKLWLESIAMDLVRVEYHGIRQALAVPSPSASASAS